MLIIVGSLKIDDGLVIPEFKEIVRVKSETVTVEVKVFIVRML